MLIRRVEREEGMGLITALMVSAIVVVFATAVVQLSIRSSDQVSYDQKRVQALSAAEAGVDYYLSLLASANRSGLSCSVTKNLTDPARAQFTVTPTFYTAANVAVACPIPSNQSPAYVLLHSVGTAGTPVPKRTMEVLATMQANPPAPLATEAIFSDSSPTFSSYVSLVNNQAYTADVYTNGDFPMTSNSVIDGSVYVQGSASLSASPQVKGDVIAKNGISLSGAGPIVNGDLRSSTSSITVGSGHVYGGAQAATSVTLSGGQVDGQIIQNTPSAAPPAQSFPVYVYDPSPWQDEGYSIHNSSDCNEAESFASSISSGNWVVRITSACNLQLGNNDSITVRGNLAIISDYGLQMSQSAQIQSDGRAHNLFLIVGLAKQIPCDFNMSSTTSIASNLDTVIYTGCTANMQSSAFIATGQIVANDVKFAANATLTSKWISVPGAAPPGYQVGIIYKREVV